MKKIVCNPYLPSWEYVPDGEPHIFGDRLYLFGSHDRFGGKVYCENDYVLWSAPVDDLSDWQCHGVIYRKEQDPFCVPGKSHLWAPDVAQGPDGRFYLYYGMDFVNRISVAVSDTPEGPYSYLGEVCYPDGTRYGGKPGELLRFDAAVLADDDGRIWLYSGFCPKEPWFQKVADKIHSTINALGNQVAELDTDMRTVISEPRFLLPGVDASDGTGFEGHAFYEASSMRKFNGKYYAVYSSFLSHELAWAVSDCPDRGFRFGGSLHSNGNVLGPSQTATYPWGNNHGSIVCVQGEYYVFGHRQTNGTECSRQRVAEKLRFENGGFLPAELTSQGLYGQPLPPDIRYEAGIACVLHGKAGAAKTTMTRRRDARVTQEGKDRESDPCQYIANIRSGTVIGYRYFDLSNVKSLTVEWNSLAVGTLTVSDTPDGEPICAFPVRPGKASPGALLSPHSDVSALYFRFTGLGKLDLYAFFLSTR